MDERFIPSDTFFSVTHKADTPAKATEEQLLAIYDASFRGLTGDSLAYNCGFYPVDFRRLCEFDEKAAEAVIRARADCEALVSGALMRTAMAGDTKAALGVLKHKFGWKEAKAESDNSAEIRIIVENAEEHIVPGEDG